MIEINKKEIFAMRIKNKYHPKKIFFQEYKKEQLEDFIINNQNRLFQIPYYSQEEGLCKLIGYNKYSPFFVVYPLQEEIGWYTNLFITQDCSIIIPSSRGYFTKSLIEV